MTGKVKLSLLGGFRLAGPDNHPLTVKLRKSEALLAYLACQGSSAITREHTANLLWGDFDQQRARQSLRQAVLDIKKTFGDKETVPIEMGREFISLRGDSVDIDVSRFENLVQEGTIGALKEACELYKGEFLFGFSVRASDFDGWLMAMRNRYLEMFCRASLSYMERVSGSSPSLGIEVGQRAFRQDMLREDILRALMRLYAKAGRRAAAIESYQECARYLERELATTPDDETIALFNELNGQNTTLSFAQSNEAPNEQIVPSGSAYNSGFLLIGRESELAELRAHMSSLSRGLGRLLFLIGDRGIGKSQLLTAISEDQEKSVFFIRISRNNNGLGDFWDKLGKALSSNHNPSWEDTSTIRDRSSRSQRMDDLIGGETFAASEALGAESSALGGDRAQLTDLLRYQARTRPLTLAIDGLQYLDHEGLSEFLLWAKRVCNNPILLTVAWPTDDPDVDLERQQAVDSAIRQAHTSVMTIAALGYKWIADLCDEFTSRLDFKALSSKDKDWVWNVSQGNPKAALAILLDWTEGIKAGPLAERPLPKAFSKEAEERLAGLSEAERDFVSLVAVAGPTTPLEVIEAVSGLPLDEFAKQIQKLIKLHILRSIQSAVSADRASNRLAESKLHFKNERMRLALVAELRPEKKRTLHQAIASSYLALKGRRNSAFASDIAAHFTGAGDIAASFGYGLVGAGFDIRRGDYKSAEACFGDLLEALQRYAHKDIPNKRMLEPKIRLGLSLVAEFEEKFSEVLNLTGSISPSALAPEDRSTLEVIRARALFALGDRDSALRAVRRAEGKAVNGRAGDAWLLPDVFLGLGAAGRLDRKELESQLSLELEDAGALNLLHDRFEITGTLVLLLAQQRKYEEARRRIAEIDSLLAGHKHTRFAALAIFLNGMVELYGGNARLAEHLFLEAETTAVTCGDLYRLYLILGHRGIALQRLERMDDAKEALERCCTLAENFDSPPLRAAFFAELHALECGERELGREVMLQSAKDNDFWALNNLAGNT